MGRAGCEDLRPLHLQVAIRFAFSVLPSLSLSTAQPTVLLLHLGGLILSFHFLCYFFFLFREKCNLLIKLAGREGCWGWVVGGGFVSKGELTNGIVDAGLLVCKTN